jgi:hypothetical protein
MKKVLLILVPLLLVSLLAAIDFEFDGENRTRGAVYNDANESDGGHIDNRTLLGINALYRSNLSMKTTIQFGDVVWGGYGGSIPASVPISAYELYLNYRFRNTNIRVGQQYWKDNMSLILDDTFSGIMVSNDNLAGFETEIGWIKALERKRNDFDDYNYLLLNMQKMTSSIPWGFYASFGWDADYRNQNKDYTHITLMPYLSYDSGALTCNANVFMGLHFLEDADTEVGIGAAAKADIDVGPVIVSGDVLFSIENGIAVLSPYYQNGLYIYGINEHNDALNLYWDNPYSNNNDTVLSLVGKVKGDITRNFSAFGAAGILIDKGFEINGGVEFKLIPDILSLTGYAALGIGTDDGPTNYALGTTLKMYIKD